MVLVHNTTFIFIIYSLQADVIFDQIAKKIDVILLDYYSIYIYGNFKAHYKSTQTKPMKKVDTTVTFLSHTSRTRSWMSLLMFLIL